MKNKISLPILCIVTITLMFGNFIAWITASNIIIPIGLLILSLMMATYTLKTFFSGEEESYKEQMRKIYENSKHLPKD